MDYIVNPWLVYLIGQLEGWKFALIVFGVLGGFVAILASITTIANDSECGTHYFKQWRMLLIPTVVLCAISIFIATILPNQKTLIAMIVAENATYTNVGKAIEVGKDIKNDIKKDIIDMLREIKSDNNTKGE